MLNSISISYILEGIFIESDCGMDRLLKETTTFFDIYEKEIHNKIIKDKDYINVLNNNPESLLPKCKELQPAVLCWWLKDEYIKVSLPNLIDEKGRSFIDPFGIFEETTTSYNKSELFKLLKTNMPVAYKKLIKQGEKIIRLHERRIEIKNDLNYYLTKNYLSIDLLQKECPEIYEYYKKGRIYKSSRP